MSPYSGTPFFFSRFFWLHWVLVTVAGSALQFRMEPGPCIGSTGALATWPPGKSSPAQFSQLTCLGLHEATIKELAILNSHLEAWLGRICLWVTWQLAEFISFVGLRLRLLLDLGQSCPQFFGLVLFSHGLSHVFAYFIKSARTVLVKSVTLHTVESKLHTLPNFGGWGVGGGLPTKHEQTWRQGIVGTLLESAHHMILPWFDFVS